MEEEIERNRWSRMRGGGERSEAGGSWKAEGVWEKERNGEGIQNSGMYLRNLCGRFSLLFVMNKIQIISTEINTDTKIEILTFWEHWWWVRCTYLRTFTPDKEWELFRKRNYRDERSR